MGNRIKVNATGTIDTFNLGVPVTSFVSFKDGDYLVTIISATNKWQVCSATVLGVTLTVDTVEENYNGTTNKIDFTGDSIQIGETLTDEWRRGLYNKTETDALLYTKEPVIDPKESGFNLPLGTAPSTIAEGDHVHSALVTTYDNANSGLIATDVKGAIDEIVSSGGVIEYTAIADATTGTIEGDVNSTDWTGHAQADGTSLYIQPSHIVSFGNSSGVIYRWIGPKDVKLGLGGNTVTSAADYQATGIGDHNTLAGRSATDAHPISAITDLQTELNAKEPTIVPNTAYNKNFGTTATEVCVGNDARLSDTRDPNAHNQDISTINNLQTELDAKEPEITPKLDAFNSAFGNSADTVCEGDDSRLSDARAPVAHQHDAIDITGESWLLNIVEDVTPELGGNLDTKGNDIALGDGSGGYEGVLINLGTETGCALAYSSDGTYDANNGAIVCQPGQVAFGGALATFSSLASSQDNQVYCDQNGALYKVSPPVPGWEETDLDNGDYALPTLSTWVELTGLVIIAPQDVSPGDTLNITTNLHVINNDPARAGSIAINFSIDGAIPVTSGVLQAITGGFDGLIPIVLSTTTHGGVTSGQTISVWAQRATEDHGNFDPEIHGSTGSTHELKVSIPGAGGSGTTDHNALTNRNMADQHSTASVTGLDTALAGKEPVKGVNDNYVTDSEKVDIVNLSGTNTGDNSTNSNYVNDYRSTNFVAMVDYEPAKTANDNFVSDAEKIVIGNTSGANSGDDAVNINSVSNNVSSIGALSGIIVTKITHAISLSRTEYNKIAHDAETAKIQFTIDGV